VAGLGWPLWAASPEVTEAETSIRVRTESCEALIDRRQGGALAALGRPGAPQPLLTAHQVYTDFGLYPDRGYVGTGKEPNAKTTVERQGDIVVVTSQGQLQGEPAAGRELSRYRLTYRFGSAPGVAVECEVVPAATATTVSAFLATYFTLPRLREWAVNTVDGIIREDVGDGKQRDYESTRLAIHAQQPQVGFIMDDGTSLLVTDIRSSAPTPLQNCIIHGRSLFLAWLSGAEVKVSAAPYRVSFRLIPGRGDPMVP
jgi:hypothetical protein